MNEVVIVRREDYEPEKRISPIDKIIADLPPGKYYKLSEVAKILGVSQTTIRRQIKKPGIQAPSEVLLVGKVSTYLYTPDDIEELRDALKTAVKKRR